MNTALSLVREALALAGQDQQLVTCLQRLETRRITPNKDLPQMAFLFRLFGKPCFPRGELVGLTGKPKSGKTFVSSILMTLCFREQALSEGLIVRTTNAYGHVAYYRPQPLQQDLFSGAPGDAPF